MTKVQLDESFSTPEHVYGKAQMIDDFNELVGVVHDLNYSRGWWTIDVYGNAVDMRPTSIAQADNAAGGELGFGFPLVKMLGSYVVGTKIALAHSELSEGLEAYRKNLMDDKLTDRPGLEVELVDTIIRCLDLLGAFGYNAGETLVRVLENNLVRKDHDPEVRKQGGKKF